MNIKGGSRRSYVTPIDYYSDDDLMITDRQKRLITDYIMTLQDDDEKEQRLSQLSDLSSLEADDMLFEISKWQ